MFKRINCILVKNINWTILVLFIFIQNGLAVTVEDTDTDIKSDETFYVQQPNKLSNEADNNITQIAPISEIDYEEIDVNNDKNYDESNIDENNNNNNNDDDDGVGDGDENNDNVGSSITIETIDFDIVQDSNLRNNSNTGDDDNDNDDNNEKIIEYMDVTMDNQENQEFPINITNSKSIISISETYQLSDKLNKNKTKLFQPLAIKNDEELTTITTILTSEPVGVKKTTTTGDMPLILSKYPCKPYSGSHRYFDNFKEKNSRYGAKSSSVIKPERNATGGSGGGGGAYWYRMHVKRHIPTNYDPNLQSHHSAHNSKNENDQTEHNYEKIYSTNKFETILDKEKQYHKKELELRKKQLQNKWKILPKKLKKYQTYYPQYENNGNDALLPPYMKKYNKRNKQLLELMEGGGAGDGGGGGSGGVGDELQQPQFKPTGDNSYNNGMVFTHQQQQQQQPSVYEINNVITNERSSQQQPLQIKTLLHSNHQQHPYHHQQQRQSHSHHHLNHHLPHHYHHHHHQNHHLHQHHQHHQHHNSNNNKNSKWIEMNLFEEQRPHRQLQQQQQQQQLQSTIHQKQQPTLTDILTKEIKNVLPGEHDIVDIDNDDSFTSSKHHLFSVLNSPSSSSSSASSSSIQSTTSQLQSNNSASSSLSSSSKPNFNFNFHRVASPTLVGVGSYGLLRKQRLPFVAITDKKLSLHTTASAVNSNNREAPPFLQ